MDQVKVRINPDTISPGYRDSFIDELMRHNNLTKEQICKIYFNVIAKDAHFGKPWSLVDIGNLKWTWSGNAYMGKRYKAWWLFDSDLIQGAPPIKERVKWISK